MTEPAQQGTSGQPAQQGTSGQPAQQGTSGQPPQDKKATIEQVAQAAYAQLPPAAAATGVQPKPSGQPTPGVSWANIAKKAVQPPQPAAQQPQPATQQQARSPKEQTKYVIQYLVDNNLAAGIVWDPPWCMRGWISSLMPTATFRVKNIKCDGNIYEIRQNGHGGGVTGSVWIHGTDGDVKPNDLPGAWKQAIAPALSAADNMEQFQKEKLFSDYLKSKGADNIGQPKEGDIRIKNRWLSLRARFGADEVKKAPGGDEAIGALGKGWNPPASEGSGANALWKPLN